MSSRRRAIRILLAIDLLIGAGLAFVYAPLPSDAPLIIGHRGDLEHFPENTLAGVLSAASLGADGVEIDLHRSADGTWWLMHHPDIDFTTPGTGLVSDLTDAEMAGLTIDAGPGFRPEHAGLHHPITLDEMLGALAAWPDFVVVLDVKERGPAAARSAAEVAERHGLGERAWIITDSVDSASAAVAAYPPITPTLRGVTGDFHRLMDAHAEAMEWAWLSLTDAPLVAYANTDLTLDAFEQLDRASRWNAAMYIGNSMVDSVAWRTERLGFAADGG